MIKSELTKINNNKTRDTSLDAVCGLFIIYMIVTHAFQWSWTTDDSFYVNIQYVFFMFMPWFFFKSGMFHKKTNIKVVINQGIKRLVVPFAIYSILGEFVYWCRLYLQQGMVTWQNILKGPIRELVFQGSLSGNLALWFLLTLFIVKVSISIADKYNFNKAFVLIGALVISGGGTIMSRYIDNIPLLLLNVPEGLLFYVAGYYLRSIQYYKITIIIASVVFFTITVIEPSFIGVRSDNVIQGYWILGIINSVAGIILFDNLFKIKFIQFPILTSIGRNSMEYFCAHWILFHIVAIIYKYGENVAPNYDELFTLLWASVIVLPCYQYWYKLSIGQKNYKMTKAQDY
jgi:hypothetical protein